LHAAVHPILVHAGNLKVGKPMCCFFFRTQHRFFHRKNL